MHNKKLVSRDCLEDFSKLLDVYLEKYPDLEQLKYFFDHFILEKVREDWNEIKRNVYKKMKASTGEENKHWYLIYQNIKQICDKEVALYDESHS